MLRGMTKKERTAFLEKVKKEGSSEYIASILEAMPEMSGMSDAEVKQLKNSYIRKHAPEFLEELRILDTAESTLIAAYETFEQASVQYHNAQLEKIALQKEQAANQAKQQFDDAVTGK